MIRHFIVNHALTGNGALFQTVESGGVVLVVHDEPLGVIGFENLFGFALVNLFQFSIDCGNLSTGSGKIVADSIGEIVREDSIMQSTCEICVGEER